MNRTYLLCQDPGASSHFRLYAVHITVILGRPRNHQRFILCYSKTPTKSAQVITIQIVHFLSFLSKDLAESLNSLLSSPPWPRTFGPSFWNIDAVSIGILPLRARLSFPKQPRLRRCATPPRWYASEAFLQATFISECNMYANIRCCSAQPRLPALRLGSRRFSVS